MIGRRVHYLLPFICLLLLSTLSVAQDGTAWAGFGIEANAFAGKVLKHSPKFRLPIPNVTTGLDINFQQKTYGKKEWHQRRRWPIIGVGVAYTNYGIDSIYGRCFSIYPNITIPLITGRKLEWTLRIGDGAGYVTRDYSRLSPHDTTNGAIGSHLNDYASLLMDLRYHINDHWDVQLGGNLSHISDASYHQPNLGINLYGAHVGIKYFPVTANPKHIVRKQEPLPNRWLAEFRITMAKNQSYAPGGPSYPIYLGTVYASKRWISKNKLMLGLDYSYNSNVYAYLKNNSFVAENTEYSHSYKSGIFAGNEFLLGRVGFVLQAGYYLHQSFLETSKFYEKLGGNFYLIRREHGPVKELFACAFLKTHSTVAELAEFGFGMGF